MSGGPAGDSTLEVSNTDLSNLAGWPTAAQLRTELPTHLDQEALDFLRAEYEHLSASFISNEESGETRVNVFLGLVAAGSAGLGFAADAFKEEPTVIVRAVAAVSLVLLLFGLATLRRVMERNLATTEHLNGLRVIRASYLVRHPDLLAVMPFTPALSPRLREKKEWGLGKAGFLETVTLANAALAGIAAGAVASAPQPSSGIAVGFGIAVAFVAWVLQIRWTRRVYEKGQADAAKKRLKALAWWQNTLGGRHTGE